MGHYSVERAEIGVGYAKNESYGGKFESLVRFWVSWTRFDSSQNADIIVGYA